MFKRATVRRQRRNMVVAAVHCRAHQVVETGIHQHKMTAPHLFSRCVPASPARRIAPPENVPVQFPASPDAPDGERFARGRRSTVRSNAAYRPPSSPSWIRDRQPASRRNRLQILPKIDNLGAPSHRTPAPDDRNQRRNQCACGSQQAEADGAASPPARQARSVWPDAVFAVLAAGIGFLAVPVTKTGIDTQPDAMTRRNLPPADPAYPPTPAFTGMRSSLTRASVAASMTSAVEDNIIRVVLRIVSPPPARAQFHPARRNPPLRPCSRIRRKI
ncbi:Uncharacterised protein [Citrobacter koseri]|uniref:Uncharacterized protein n=1 Tax=Citrobacter koseri TaxID=545 RepID=A0A2X2YW83_CITKO|nr:Uncharacterised protein [Citrobacter koseri]